MSAGSVFAEEPQQGANFLKLSQGQRYWWVEGAILTSSHLISLRGDKTKGECISKWYLGDRDAKQKLIADTMAKFPAEGPTTIILSLLQQACGKFTP